MTSLAFGIVIPGGSIDPGMWIVARAAANPHVGAVEAFAVSQTVRLEAYVLNSARSAYRDLRPGAVTLAAEIRHFFGVARSQFRDDCLTGVARANRLQMCFRRAMASFALHTLDHS